MKLRFLPAVPLLLSLLAPAARGEVLVYEGFHPADYNNVAADDHIQANTTFTANHTVGISSSKWSSMNGTQVRVFGENFGLALPQTMMDAGFTAIGGAIGCNPKSDNSEMRAMNHALASKVLNVTSGTLYVRVLVNLDSAAAGKLTARSELVGNAGNYYACGFCMAPSGNDYHLLTHTRSAIAFLLWKNADNQYVLSLGHTTAAEATATFYPLVTGITLGETYLCYAEIRVEAGTGGNEIVRAGAVATSDFTGAAPWATLGGGSDSVEVQLISASAYPTVMAVAGPYGTNKGCFRADEIVIGTEMGDILPVGGVFSVSATGSPTVATNSFSTAWILVADEGVTADAGLVWSTDETFATATTNSLGTGLVADTRTASLTGLDPDTTYWWKIVADNGTEVAETTPASFTTPGAPVFGTTTATVTGESAAFSVALEEAALVNTLATSVSVFYGTDGENWTELPLGTTAVATTLSGSADSLGYGITYQWFARATATMEGGRVLSADSATGSFTTLYNGDMHVDAAAENATPPYSTPATAAKTIAAALALATDGATIHVAPGQYNISDPLNVTSAIRILGDDPDPSRTVVSNRQTTGWDHKNQRCFYVNHADAVVANLTMQKGGVTDQQSGGNFYVGSAGGMVSNCVVEAGDTLLNSYAGGGRLDGGLVTHTVFRKNKCGSNSGSWQGSSRSGVLSLRGSSRAENCLFVDNRQDNAVVLIQLEGSAVLRNCTVADTALTTTNDYCKTFAALNIASGATVQNVVVVGVTNTLDGSTCAAAVGTATKFLNGAFDGDASALPAGTVVGTAASFFPHYAENVPYAVKYRPKSGGPLADKGANYEPMALYDLSGIQKRKIGSHVDIGCYEGNAAGFILLMK